MARIARQHSTEDAALVRDPPAGTPLPVPAGGEIEAEFTIRNNAPEESSFSLMVDGAASAFAYGVGPDSAHWAPARGIARLRLTLRPPETAQLGDYDFRVSIYSDGDLVQEARPLILRVGQPEGAPLSALSPSTVRQPETLAATVGAPSHVEYAASDAAPAAPAHPVIGEQAAPPVIGEPEAPIFPSAPPSPAPAAPFASATPEPAAPTAAEPAPPPRAEPQPAQIPSPSRPADEPAAGSFVWSNAQPAAAAPPPAPLAAPSPAPLPPTPAQAAAAQPFEADPEEILLNPMSGEEIELRPGETRLVGFSFKNAGSGMTTYVLQQDTLLGDAMMSVVTGSTSIERGVSGQVTFRLHPPINAVPGPYPIEVMHGPQGGALTRCRLTLRVLATPAVKIKVRTPVFRMSPLFSFAAANFDLTVESAGNSQTAFRIGVLPETEQEREPGEPPPREYIYEAPDWRYVFDREMADLKSPGGSLPIQPRQIKLRLMRRNWWWFGFTEKHTVRVAAVPVTDPTNGGKPGNVVQLTATRRRYWPMPLWACAVILALLLFVMSPAPSELSVSSANSCSGQAGAEANTYIWQPVGQGSETLDKEAVPMSVDLTWPGRSLFRMHAQATDGVTSLDGRLVANGSAVDKFVVNRNAYYGTCVYTLGPLLWGNSVAKTVFFVPVRTDNKLGLSADGVPAAMSAGPQDGWTQATVRVPRGRAVHLTLRNLSSDLRICYFEVAIPDGFEATQNLTPEGDYVDNGGSSLIPIKRTADAQDGDMILVTTDGAARVLDIHLKAE